MSAKRLLACVVVVLSASGLLNLSAAEWMPGSRLFRPLAANVFEPRMAMMYQGADKTYRLDIGGGADLLRISKNEATEIRLGGEFATWSRLRGEGNFKFPVETTDFWFGIYGASVTRLSDAASLELRARFAHISSHIVDGWSGPREPFVYSREFFDLAAALRYGMVRPYAGATILTAVQPANRFGRFIPQVGFDFIDSSLVGSSVSIIGGWNSHFPVIDGSMRGAHTARLGVKIGNPMGAGVSLTGYWYEGMSIHGMFFDWRDSYLGFGFEFDY